MPKQFFGHQGMRKPKNDGEKCGKADRSDSSQLTVASSIFSVATLQRSSNLSSSSSNSTMRRFSDATSASAWSPTQRRIYYTQLCIRGIGSWRWRKASQFKYNFYIRHELKCTRGLIRLISKSPRSTFCNDTYVHTHNYITVQQCIRHSNFNTFAIPLCNTYLLAFFVSIQILPFRLIRCLGCFLQFWCGYFQSVLGALQILFHKNDAAIQGGHFGFSLFF